MINSIKRVRAEYDREDRLDFGGREFVIPRELKEQLDTFLVFATMTEKELKRGSFQHSEDKSTAYIDHHGNNIFRINILFDAGEFTEINLQTVIYERWKFIDFCSSQTTTISNLLEEARKMLL